MAPEWVTLAKSLQVTQTPGWHPLEKSPPSHDLMVPSLDEMGGVGRVGSVGPGDSYISRGGTCQNASGEKHHLHLNQSINHMKKINPRVRYSLRQVNPKIMNLGNTPLSSQGGAMSTYRGLLVIFWIEKFPCWHNILQNKCLQWSVVFLCFLYFVIQRL